MQITLGPVFMLRWAWSDICIKRDTLAAVLRLDCGVGGEGRFRDLSWEAIVMIQTGDGGSWPRVIEVEELGNIQVLDIC